MFDKHRTVEGGGRGTFVTPNSSQNPLFLVVFLKRISIVFEQWLPQIMVPRLQCGTKWTLVNWGWFVDIWAFHKWQMYVSCHFQIFLGIWYWQRYRNEYSDTTGVDWYRYSCVEVGPLLMISQPYSHIMLSALVLVDILEFGTKTSSSFVICL